MMKKMQALTAGLLAAWMFCGFAPVMPVNAAKNDAFIERGGRIPAPLHSLKN